MYKPNGNRSILDYSTYVEVVQNDSCGIYQSQPTARDFLRNAGRICRTLTDPNYQMSDTPLDHYVMEYIRVRVGTENKLSGHGGRCPICKNTLSHEDDVRSPHPIRRDVWTCSCGWWHASEYVPPPYEATDFEMSFSIDRHALLREFKVGDLDVPISTLRAFLSMHPDYMYGVTPTRFEHLVSDIFSDYLDCEVVHVGKSHDGGIDAIVLDGNEQRVIQIKRRESAERVEGVSEIREFLGAMLLHGSRRGMFITTSHHFSAPAEKSTKTAEEKGIVDRLDLIDCRKLTEILRLTERRNRPPWHASLLPDNYSLNHSFLMKTQMRELFMDLALVRDETREYDDRVICHYINEK